MGVRGIARDLAAAGLGTLKPLADVYRMASLAPIAGDGPGPDVRTDDAEGCPAFFAQRVSGVTNGAAPDWMRQRLTAVGQKPISALVDITNYRHRSISADRCTSMTGPSCPAALSRARRGTASRCWR